jgi:hypothetical protein
VLVALCAVLASVWLVPQVYVGSYLATIFGADSILVWAGLAAVAIAASAHAILARRLPWLEIVVSISVYVIAEIAWRTTIYRDAGTAYKLVWVLMGTATPVVAYAAWAIATALARKSARMRQVTPS